MKVISTIKGESEHRVLNRLDESSHDWLSFMEREAFRRLHTGQMAGWVPERMRPVKCTRVVSELEYYTIFLGRQDPLVVGTDEEKIEILKKLIRADKWGVTLKHLEEPWWVLAVDTLHGDAHVISEFNENPTLRAFLELEGDDDINSMQNLYVFGVDGYREAPLTDFLKYRKTFKLILSYVETQWASLISHRIKLVLAYGNDIVSIRKRLDSHYSSIHDSAQFEYPSETTLHWGPWLDKHSSLWKYSGYLPIVEKKLGRIAHSKEEFLGTISEEVLATKELLGLDISPDDMSLYTELYATPHSGPKYTPDPVAVPRTENGFNLTMSQLEPGDKIGPVLGKLTNCCQHLSGDASDCARNIWFRKDCSAWVIKNNEKVVAQSYIWMNSEGMLVIDSVEFNSDHTLSEMMEELVVGMYKETIDNLISSKTVRCIAIAETHYGITSDLVGKFPVHYGDLVLLNGKIRDEHVAPVGIQGKIGYSDAGDVRIVGAKILSILPLGNMIEISEDKPLWEIRTFTNSKVEPAMPAITTRNLSVRNLFNAITGVSKIRPETWAPARALNLRLKEDQLLKDVFLRTCRDQDQLQINEHYRFKLDNDSVSGAPPRGNRWNEEIRGDMDGVTIHYSESLRADLGVSTRATAHELLTRAGATDSEANLATTYGPTPVLSSAEAVALYGQANSPVDSILAEGGSIAPYPGNGVRPDIVREHRDVSDVTPGVEDYFLAWSEQIARAMRAEQLRARFNARQPIDFREVQRHPFLRNHADALSFQMDRSRKHHVVFQRRLPRKRVIYARQQIPPYELLVPE